MPAHRILLICNSYPPETGAAPLRMQGIAQLLVKAGYEVAVLCGIPNYPTGHVFPEYRKRGVVVEKLDGVSIYRIPFLPSQSPRRWIRVGSLFSLSSSILRYGGAVFRKFRPDWTIVSSPPLPLAICGAQLARRFKVPMLLNVSDLWPLTAKELGAVSNSTLYQWLEKAETWLFNQAKGRMGQSEEILRYMNKDGIHPRPAFLYRNLPQSQVHTTGFPKTNSGKRRLVYAGLIGPVQGILQVAQHIDFAALNLELHIYGDGADRPLLERYLKEHPNKGITLHGRVPAEEMFRLLPLYDAALVTLSKTIYGAVPSKFFAAAAAGLPVVFSANGEGSALVKKYGLGWHTPPADMEALYGALREFSEYPQERLAQMQAQVQKALQTHFNTGEQEAAFMRFFESLMA